LKLQTLFILSLSTLLISIMSLIFYFNFKNTQTFIENQVYSNAQNTAYSLGLSLSALGQDTNNSVEQVLQINAIFDSGYYEYIRFTDMNKTLIHEASLPLVIKDVPEWFMYLVPLHLSEAQSEVNSDWLKVGILYVKGHTGHAYYQLYKNFKDLAVIFGLIGFLALVVLFIIVNVILKTLIKIQGQAEAVSENKFIILKHHTFVIEFSTMMATMNKMVTKIENVFSSEVETFQNYQNLLYKDDESQLFNKRYLILKLKELFSGEDEHFLDRKMALISIAGLEEIKDREGYFKYRDVFNEIKEGILKEIKSQHLLVRVSDTEIAILFDMVVDDTIEKTLNGLKHVFERINNGLQIDKDVLTFYTGITPLLPADNEGNVLSRADYSVQQAKVRGCQLFCSVETLKTASNSLVSEGKEAWRKTFEEIFQNNRITFATQKVVESKTAKTYHEETFLRIIDHNGVVQTAGFYLPMALSIHRVAKIDETIVRLVLEKIESFKNPVAINLSSDFIEKSRYFEMLSEQLSALDEKYHHKLHFEIKENDILQNLQNYIKFAEMIEKNSQTIGVDNFSGVESIEYVKALRPSYIKISASNVKDLEEGNKAILKTLDVLTEIMDIKIIVTSIQSEEVYERLLGQNYSYFQGHYIEEPKL